MSDDSHTPADGEPVDGQDGLRPADQAAAQERASEAPPWAERPPAEEPAGAGGFPWQPLTPRDQSNPLPPSFPPPVRSAPSSSPPPPPAIQSSAIQSSAIQSPSGQSPVDRTAPRPPAPPGSAQSPPVGPVPWQPPVPPSQIPWRQPQAGPPGQIPDQPQSQPQSQPQNQPQSQRQGQHVAQPPPAGPASPTTAFSESRAWQASARPPSGPVAVSPSPPLPPRTASPYQAPTYSLGAGKSAAETEPATPPARPAPPDREDRPDRPERKTVSRAGAWSISLVSALVAAALAVGGTYVLVKDEGANKDEGGSVGDRTPVDTTTSSPIEGLTSGKNVPEIPEAAYDGESPQWNVVAAQVQPTVVAIQINASELGAEAQGSGVIINSEKGYVVTNNHVVAGSKQIDVVLSDGRIFTAEVLGTDPTTDLAVVELDNPPEDLVEAELGDSSEVVVGEPVMAVGNPLGLDNTVTTGIVSALNRPVMTEAVGASSSRDSVVTNAIQLDAAVNPGNSGGPLFNSKGQVIGINSSIATLSGMGSEAGNIGLAFAIPVNQVATVASQLIDKGTADHPYLGVDARSVKVEIEGVYRVGARLDSIQSGSPAAAAGLKRGDVILAVNGHPISGATSLTAWIRSYAPGEKVVLAVMQGRDAKDIEATLAKREDS